MVYAIIAVILLIADQWLKYWVTVNITLATGSEALIPGVVKLVNIHNSGAAFGLLDGVSYARWIFLGIAAVMVVLIVMLLVRRTFDSKFAVWCEVLFLAGALGNCIDRVLYGYVVDMFKLEFVNFAVFNIADAVLVVSCLMFIIYLFVGERDEGDKKPERKPEPVEPVDEFHDIFGIKSTNPAAAVAPGKEKTDVFSIGDSSAEFPAENTPIRPDDAFWGDFKASLHAEETPAEKPKPQPKAAPAAESFDIEDILAEFRDI